MAIGISKTPAKPARIMFAGQALLSALASLILIFAPRGDDAPIMLLPLTANAQQELPDMLSAPGTLIISRADWDGAYIIRRPHSDFLGALMGGGILMLNASAPGCGPTTQEARR